jgi:hypothetical protein
MPLVTPLTSVASLGMEGTEELRQNCEHLVA